MGAIQDAFTAALAKFNAGLYDELSHFLHREVILNEVDSPYTPHQGATKVINYLKSRQANKLPQLKPGTIHQVPQDPIPHNATHGQVSGEATYQDNSIPYIDNNGVLHPASGKPPVRYVFNFRFEQDRWLLINGTAVLVSHTRHRERGRK